jgi:hypothetical protein
MNDYTWLILFNTCTVLLIFFVPKGDILELIEEVFVLIKSRVYLLKL